MFGNSVRTGSSISFAEITRAVSLDTRFDRNANEVGNFDNREVRQVQAQASRGSVSKMTKLFQDAKSRVVSIAGNPAIRAQGKFREALGAVDAQVVKFKDALLAGKTGRGIKDQAERIESAMAPMREFSGFNPSAVFRARLDVHLRDMSDAELNRFVEAADTAMKDMVPGESQSHFASPYAVKERAIGEQLRRAISSNRSPQSTVTAPDIDQLISQMDNSIASAQRPLPQDTRTGVRTTSAMSKGDVLTELNNIVNELDNYLAEQSKSSDKQ